MTDRVVAYVSDQAHSSVARAARLLGFRPDQVRVLPTRRAPAHAARRARRRDRRGRGAPGASRCSWPRRAGSTNTGAIDPLPELAAICRERGVVVPRRRRLRRVRGADRARPRGAARASSCADSVTLDPHKWLYQPFECGALLVRDGPPAAQAFEIVPDYLKDAARGGRRGELLPTSASSSRAPARALKVWLSV